MTQFDLTDLLPPKDDSENPNVNFDLSGLIPQSNNTANDALVKYRNQLRLRGIGKEQGQWAARAAEAGPGSEESKRIKMAFNRGAANLVSGAINALPDWAKRGIYQQHMAPYGGLVETGADPISQAAAYLRGAVNEYRPQEESSSDFIRYTESAFESLPITAVGVVSAIGGQAFGVPAPVGGAVGGAVGGYLGTYASNKYQAEVQVDRLIDYYKSMGADLPESITDEAIDDMAFAMSAWEGGVEAASNIFLLGSGAAVSKAFGHAAGKQVMRRMVIDALAKKIGSTAARGTVVGGTLVAGSVTEGLEEVVTYYGQAGHNIDPLARGTDVAGAWDSFKGGMFGSVVTGTPIQATGAALQRSKNKKAQKRTEQVLLRIRESLAPLAERVQHYESLEQGTLDSSVQSAYDAIEALEEQQRQARLVAAEASVNGDVQAEQAALANSADIGRLLEAAQFELEAANVAVANRGSGERTSTIQAVDPVERAESRGKIVQEGEGRAEVEKARNALAAYGVNVIVIENDGTNPIAEYDPSTPTTIYLFSDSNVTESALFSEGLHESLHLLDHFAPEEASEVRKLLGASGILAYAADYTSRKKNKPLEDAENKLDSAKRKFDEEPTDENKQGVIDARTELEKVEAGRSEDVGAERVLGSAARMLQEDQRGGEREVVASDANTREGLTFVELEGTANAVSTGGDALTAARLPIFRALDRIGARLGLLGKEAKAAQAVADRLRTTMERVGEVKPGDTVELRGLGAERLSRRRRAATEAATDEQQDQVTALESRVERMDNAATVEQFNNMTLESRSKFTAEGGNTLVDEDGQPKEMHHFTRRDEPLTELKPGMVLPLMFHVGTAKAASDRERDVRRVHGVREGVTFGQTVPLYIRVANPVRVRDQGDDWHNTLLREFIRSIEVQKRADQYAITKWLHGWIDPGYIPKNEDGVPLTSEEHTEKLDGSHFLLPEDRGEQSNALRIFANSITEFITEAHGSSDITDVTYALAMELGFDAFVYENEIEDNGSDSYLIIDTTIATSALSGSFDLSSETLESRRLEQHDPSEVTPLPSAIMGIVDVPAGSLFMHGSPFGASKKIREQGVLRPDMHAQNRAVIWERDTTIWVTDDVGMATRFAEKNEYLSDLGEVSNDREKLQGPTTPPGDVFYVRTKEPLVLWDTSKPLGEFRDPRYLSLMQELNHRRQSYAPIEASNDLMDAMYKLSSTTALFHPDKPSVLTWGWVKQNAQEAGLQMDGILFRASQEGGSDHNQIAFITEDPMPVSGTMLPPSDTLKSRRAEVEEENPNIAAMMDEFRALPAVDLDPSGHMAGGDIKPSPGQSKRAFVVPANIEGKTYRAEGMLDLYPAMERLVPKISGDHTVGFTLNMVKNKNAQPHVYLSSIHSFPPRAGVGNNLMGVVTGLADKHGVMLKLDAEPFGHEALSKTKLVTWYKRHGFVTDRTHIRPGQRSYKLIRKPKPFVQREDVAIFDESNKLISPFDGTRYQKYRSNLRGGDESLGLKSRRANQTIRDEAEQYTSRIGIQYSATDDAKYASLDIERAKRIADAFDEMPVDDLDNPSVRAAYDALAKETTDQFEFVRDQGVQFIPWGGKGEPYANSREMFDDVNDNRRLYYFKTINAEDPDTFGPDIQSQIERGHPLLQSGGGTVLDSVGNPHEQTVNDLFRAVHDYFGHAKEQFQFGPRGEENAWRIHSKMFTPLARGAMTSETRGQNSWVNFRATMRREDGSIPGKNDPDYIPLADRPFAEQKTALLPDEFISLESRRGQEKPAKKKVAAADKPLTVPKESRIGGKNLADIQMADVRDDTPEEILLGGTEKDYSPGVRPTLSDNTTPAGDQQVLDSPLGFTIQFETADAELARDRTVAALERIAPGRAAYVEDVIARGQKKDKGNNYQGTGLPIIDIDVLNNAFSDESMRNGSRFWFEGSSTAISDRIPGLNEGDIADRAAITKKFIDNVSATSPGSEVEENFRRAIVTFVASQRGVPTDIGTRSDPVIRAAERGELGEGTNYKTAAFAETFLYLAGLSDTSPLTTNDIWVAFMFNFRKAKNSGDNAAFANPYVYQFISMYLGELTKIANSKIQQTPEYQRAQGRMDSGQTLTTSEKALLTPWTPWQLMAFPWSHKSDSASYAEEAGRVADRLAEINHPASIKLPDGRNGIDLALLVSTRGEKDIEGILEPATKIRGGEKVTAEITTAKTTSGAEADAVQRRMQRTTLKEELSKKEQAALNSARGVMLTAINTYARRLLGGGGTSGVTPAANAKAKLVSNKEKQTTPKERKKQSHVGELFAAILGARHNLTARTTNVLNNQAGGVRLVVLKSGTDSKGMGASGMYKGLMSPNFLLVIEGMTPAQRTQFMSALGDLFNQESMASNRTQRFGQGPSGSQDVAMQIFFPGTVVGHKVQAKIATEVHQYNVDNNTDVVYTHQTKANGDEVTLFNPSGTVPVELVTSLSKEHRGELTASGIESTLLDMTDPTYAAGVDAMVDGIISDEVKPGSPWRDGLSKTERQAVDEFEKTTGRDALTESVRHIRSETGSRQEHGGDDSGDVGTSQEWRDGIPSGGDFAKAVAKSQGFRIGSAAESIRAEGVIFEASLEEATTRANNFLDSAGLESRRGEEHPSFRKQSEIDFIGEDAGRLGAGKTRRTFRAGYAAGFDEQRMLKEDRALIKAERARDKLDGERRRSKARLTKLRMRMADKVATLRIQRLYEREQNQQRKEKLQQKYSDRLEQQVDAERVREQLRNEAIRAANALPKRQQADFIGRINNIRTESALARVAYQIERRLAYVSYRDAEKKTKSVTTVLARRKMSNDTRKSVNEKLAAARAMVRPGGKLIRLGTSFQNEDALAQNLYAVADAATDLVQSAMMLYAEERNDFRQQRTERNDTLLQSAEKIIDNIRGRKKARRTRKKTQSSGRQESTVQRLIRAGGDIDSLTRSVEESGELHEYLSARMREAESAYYTRRREILEELDAAAREAGYNSADDLIAAVSDDTLGLESTKTIDVVIGGEPITIRLGEAMKIAALDDETLTMIVSRFDEESGTDTPGTGIKFKEAEMDRTYYPTEGEIMAIKSQLSEKDRALVQRLKDHRETLRDPAFDVFFRLQGYQPRYVPGYEPRSRLKTSRDAPDINNMGSSGIAPAFADAGGFTKERVAGGGSAVLIGDFVGDYLNSTDALARLEHMAEPTRDAWSLLMDDQVAQAIAVVHGERAVLRLREMVANGSGMDPVSLGGFLGELTGALSGAYISLNPGTFVRVAAGGVSRMVADKDVPLSGLLFAVGTGATNAPSFAEIADKNGYFYSRNKESAVDRRANTQQTGLQEERRRMARKHFAAAFREVRAGNISEARGQLVRAFSQLGILDAIDRQLVRIAVSAHMHGGMSVDDAIRAAESTVRRTQNTASKIDDAAIVSTGRARVISKFLLPFSSDPLKAGSRLIESVATGDMKGVSRWVGSTLLNSTVNVVTRPVVHILAGIVAGILGDDDEELLAEVRTYRDWTAKTMATSAVSETVSSSGAPGYLSAQLLEMMILVLTDESTYGRTAAPAPLALDAIESIVSSVTTAISTSNPDTRNRALARLANTTLAATTGDPTAPVRRVFGALDPFDQGELQRAKRMLKGLVPKGEEPNARIQELLDRIEQAENSQ